MEKVQIIMDTYNNFVILRRGFGKKIQNLDKEECTMTISSLMSEYNSINSDSEKLTMYMGSEIDNNEKEKWYSDNFDMAKFAT